MTLYLARSVLEIKVPLKIVQQDTEDFLDPLFIKDKVGDRPIMNVEVDKSSQKRKQLKHLHRLEKKMYKGPRMWKPHKAKTILKCRQLNKTKDKIKLKCKRCLHLHKRYNPPLLLLRKGRSRLWLRGDKR